MIQNPNKESKILLSNWIPFPRKIASDYKNGLLDRAELRVYCYARLQCDPYGVATFHLESLKDDVFGSTVTKNYLNKILLSLKSKRYLYYEDRTGRTGSFEVHFPDFVSPDKKYIDISHFFIKEVTAFNIPTQTFNGSQASADPKGENQRLELSKDYNTSPVQQARSERIRGYNNDTDIENEINTDVSVSSKVGSERRQNSNTPYKCKNPRSSFKPGNIEESVALDIATKVGEMCMDRYLALINNKQFWVLEKAYGEYKEDPVGTEHIDDPPAYLNAIVQRLIVEKAKAGVGKR